MVRIHFPPPKSPQTFGPSRDDGAAVHRGRRLAAECDPVIADDVDAHEWVLLMDPAASAVGDPHSRSLRRPKPLQVVHGADNLRLVWVTGGKTPVRNCFRMTSDSRTSFQWVFRFSETTRIAEDAFWVRAIPCSAGAQQRHKIIRNGVALAGEESVSVGHRRHSPPGPSGDPTHAHLHHRQ